MFLFVVILTVFSLKLLETCCELRRGGPVGLCLADTHAAFSEYNRLCAVTALAKTTFLHHLCFGKIELKVV